MRVGSRVALILMVAWGAASRAGADHVATYDSWGTSYSAYTTFGVFGQQAGDLIYKEICDPAPPYCSGGNHAGARSYAFQFDAWHTGVLEAIYMPLWLTPAWQAEGIEGKAHFSLHTSGVDTPGVVLASWDVIDIAFDHPRPYHVDNHDPKLVLFEGEKYWLKIEPLTGASAVAWMGSQNAPGTGWRYDTLGGTTYAGSIMPAMLVNVLVDTPEPDATELALCAFAVLAVRTRRNARAIRRDH